MSGNGDEITHARTVLKNYSKELEVILHQFDTYTDYDIRMGARKIVQTASMQMRDAQRKMAKVEQTWLKKQSQ